MSKLDVHQKITVDLKMDELDVTAAETKEIRSYVKEHTGLNVSHLYIAQVKQKCGIKERELQQAQIREQPPAQMSAGEGKSHLGSIETF